MEAFSISFGKDQSEYVTQLLNDMKKEGYVVEFWEQPDGFNVKYTIYFKTLYAIYSFGHRQATAFKQIFN